MAKPKKKIVRTDVRRRTDRNSRRLEEGQLNDDAGWRGTTISTPLWRARNPDGSEDKLELWTTWLELWIVHAADPSSRPGRQGPAECVARFSTIEHYEGFVRRLNDSLVELVPGWADEPVIAGLLATYDVQCRGVTMMQLSEPLPEPSQAELGGRLF